MKNIIIITAYFVQHVLISMFAFVWASIAFPIPERYIDRYSVLALLILCFLDYFLYLYVLKNIKVRIGVAFSIYLYDIVISTISLVCFILINGYMIFAMSADIKTLSHWIWCLSFLTVLITNIIFRRKCLTNYKNRCEKTGGDTKSSNQTIN